MTDREYEPLPELNEHEIVVDTEQQALDLVRQFWEYVGNGRPVNEQGHEVRGSGDMTEIYKPKVWPTPEDWHPKQPAGPWTIRFRTVSGNSDGLTQKAREFLRSKGYI